MTPAWKSGKRSQVIAVSNVSWTIPRRTSASWVWPPRTKASRQAPAAPARAVAETSGTSPPHSRQISAARAIQASTGWSADSKVTIKTACVPSPLPLSSASLASSSRQLAGQSPDWATPRAACQAPSNDAKATAAEAR